MNKEVLYKRLDKIIVFFIMLHMASLSFSIALASISFGTWTVLWIFKIISKKQPPFTENEFREIRLITAFLLLYLLLEFLSRTFAVIPEGAYSGFKRLILVLVFFGAISNFKNLSELKNSIIAIAVIFALISIYELIRFSISYINRPPDKAMIDIRISYFAHPLTIAEIKMMVILLILPLYSLKKGFRKNLLLTLILLPIFISMVLTMSRNVYIASFICILLYGIFLNRKFLVGFILLSVIAFLLMPYQMKERVYSITDTQNNESNRSRIMMWKTGWQMIKDHPWLGIGDNEFMKVYSMYKKIEITGEGSHLHNNFLMVLCVTGIFGFIGFVGFLTTVFLKQIKYFNAIKSSAEHLIIFGSILSFLAFNIAGLFEWDFGSWQVLSLFLFIISIPFIIFTNKLKTD